MAVTSVDIDRELLAEARRLSGAKSNREAITVALEELVHRAAQLEALDGIAALDLDWSRTAVGAEVRSA